MPKALCWIGIVTAALLLLVFGLDLAVQVPFQRASVVMDIGILVGALTLGVLGWFTLREQK